MITLQNFKETIQKIFKEEPPFDPDKYFRIVPNRLTEETKKELLKLANEKDAFVDISYKVSFFKYPSKLQKFAPWGVAQMLRVTEEGSTIHKDNSRTNEFDGTYMPRRTVINYPLTDNTPRTNWYDDNKNLVCTTEYNTKLYPSLPDSCFTLEGKNNNAAILNTGGGYHNVEFTEGDKPRIVFQLCFDSDIDDIAALFKYQYGGYNI